METQPWETPAQATGRQKCTYASPGFLVCSFFLSRFGFLSSSVFFQCLFSFRLICLECKGQGGFLWGVCALPGPSPKGRVRAPLSGSSRP